MFLLAFGHLLLIAGLLHRATSKSVTAFEVDTMIAGVMALWPIFAFEAFWGVLRRDRSRPLRPVVLRAILVMLFPSWRMALTDPRSGLMWVPRIGWQAPGKELGKRLELAFSGPMLIFAFLILPILGAEYVSSEQVRDLPWFVLALDIGIAVVWVAFATELVFKASAHPRPFTFMRERWLDVAIVVLPMLEFISKWLDLAPLARLLRLGRALSPEQLTRMQKLYRLQGLATKAWHAVLMLGFLGRLFGLTPEKRLAQVEERITDLEEQLKEAHAEADELRAKIAAKTEPPGTEESGDRRQESGDRRQESGVSGKLSVTSRPSAGHCWLWERTANAAPPESNPTKR
jgi:hypothetical protein